jgi:hypothetical protein
MLLRHAEPRVSHQLRKRLLLAAALVCAAPWLSWEIAAQSPTQVRPTAGQDHRGQRAPASTAVTPAKPHVWISPAEIRALPIAGDPGCDPRCRSAWMLLKQAAAAPAGRPNLADQDEQTGNFVLAKALVAVRLNDSTTRGLTDEVVQLLRQAIGTEQGASALAVGRKLATYVIAADIIELPVSRPDFDESVFRPWLRSFATQKFEGRTLRSCHEDRPNNWGTQCGASRIAIAAYLDDRTDMTRAASVFQGWLGDRQSYAGFKFGAEAFSWMSDTCPHRGSKCQPTPVNPVRAVVNGHNVDGVVVDDQRRTGEFSWPPKYTYYSYGGLGGAVVQAGILKRFGFDAWQWGDRALRRAIEWLYYDGDRKTKWDTCDDDNKRYVLDLVDHAYGSDFIKRMDCAPAPSPPGRNIAWTSWTHQ